MSEPTVHIYTSNDLLPESLLTDNFFHSRALFDLSRQTPRHRPYMATVEEADGTVTAQLLALVRYRASLLPPYFYMQCRIYGEGSYRLADGSERIPYGHSATKGDNQGEQEAKLFALMLSALKKKMGRQVLFIEVSHLSQKLFAYREFRQLGFFPVKWMSIHNSLHSRLPEERISEKMKRRINDALAKKTELKTVSNEGEFQSFIQLLKRHNWLKPRRYMPADEFFRGLMNDAHGELLITKYHEHVIGCSALAYSQGQAFLWYSAFRRKSFHALHPDDLTLWHVINTARERGCEHIYFMDVGLPFHRNKYRDFILKFGGKPVSTYRWFCFPFL